MASPAKRGNPNWRKGVATNPGGRPKRKPITTKAVQYLATAVGRGSTVTHADKVIERLFEIIYEAEPKESIKALELLWKYLEGAPQQTVEIQYEQALQDIAARTGAPLSWIREKSRMLATRHTIDGIVSDAVSEPTERTDEAQVAVKRIKQ